MQNEFLKIEHELNENIGKMIDFIRNNKEAIQKDLTISYQGHINCLIEKLTYNIDILDNKIPSMSEKGYNKTTTHKVRKALGYFE